MKELGQVTELVRGGAGTETRVAALLSLCPTTPRGRADACAHVHLGVQGQHCSGGWASRTLPCTLPAQAWAAGGSSSHTRHRCFFGCLLSGVLCDRA